MTPAAPAREVTDGGMPATELSLLGMIASLLRHRVMIAIIIVLGVVPVLVFALTAKRAYTVESLFMPQGGRSGGSPLSGIAATMGISLGGEGGESPGFYADLVKTHGVLRAAAESRYEYTTNAGKVSGALAEIWEITEGTPAQRLDLAVRRLDKRVTSQVIQKSGMIRISTTAADPELARQINTRLLELINRFNQESRRSQASSERAFTEKRLEEVRGDLQRAEDELAAFLTRNRQVEAPELVVQRERLQRNLNMQTQIFGTLASAFEQAKIEEVRDTPVITVVEQPTAPLRPNPRQLWQRAVIAAVVAGFVGLLIAVTRDAMAGAYGSDGAGLAELARLRRDAARDLLHPFRAIRRAASRDGSAA